MKTILFIYSLRTNQNSEENDDLSEPEIYPDHLDYQMTGGPGYPPEPESPGMPRTPGAPGKLVPNIQYCR